jgi:hypothetical protein
VPDIRPLKRAFGGKRGPERFVINNCLTGPIRVGHRRNCGIFAKLGGRMNKHPLARSVAKWQVDIDPRRIAPFGTGKARRSRPDQRCAQRAAASGAGHAGRHFARPHQCGATPDVVSGGGWRSSRRHPAMVVPAWHHCARHARKLAMARAPRSASARRSNNHRCWHSPHSITEPEGLGGDRRGGGPVGSQSRCHQTLQGVSAKGKGPGTMHGSHSRLG